MKLKKIILKARTQVCIKSFRYFLYISNMIRKNSLNSRICLSSNAKNVICSSFLLIFASLAPNLSADYVGPNGGNILMSSESSFSDIVSSNEDNLIAFSDDGFVMKVSPQTSKGDRSRM